MELTTAHVSHLAFATNDATAVADTLRDRFGFPPDKMKILLNGDATAEGIRSAFLSFATSGEVGPEDRIVVFFAGHGTTRSGQRGEVGYLVPVDGDPKALQSLIRWDELTRNADLIPAKHIFFVMDACYGGLALQRGPVSGSMRFVGNMLTRYARQVLTAGKANETVADGNGIRPGHSIFTARLLEALEGKAATEEGIITASGVMAYVYDRVGNDQYSHQTPHYGFVDGDGDFVFDIFLVEKLRANPPLGAGDGGGSPKDILTNVAPTIYDAELDRNKLTDTMKDLLSDESKRIKLDDYVTLHTRRFLELTDLRNFPVQGGASPTKEAFAERIQRYEHAAKDLEQILVLLARWGTGAQLELLQRTFVRLAETDKGGAGFTAWLDLSWYPVFYLMYVAGVAALASRNYNALSCILLAPVTEDGREGTAARPLIVLAVDHITGVHDFFKGLPGHERHFVPRSEYLFKQLQPVLEDVLLLGRSYEIFFDEFEVLLAMEYAEVAGRDWAPLGRFGWKHRRSPAGPLTRVLELAKTAGEKWGPVQAGMFGGALDNVIKDGEVVDALVKRVSWF